MFKSSMINNNSEFGAHKMLVNLAIAMTGEQEVYQVVDT